LRDGIIASSKAAVGQVLTSVEHYHGARGIFARTWMTSTSVQIVLAVLTLYLLFMFQNEGRSARTVD